MGPTAPWPPQRAPLAKRWRRGPAYALHPGPCRRESAATSVQLRESLPQDVCRSSLFQPRRRRSIQNAWGRGPVACLRTTDVSSMGPWVAERGTPLKMCPRAFHSTKRNRKEITLPSPPRPDVDIIPPPLFVCVCVCACASRCCNTDLSTTNVKKCMYGMQACTKCVRLSDCLIAKLPTARSSPPLKGQY